MEHSIVSTWEDPEIGLPRFIAMVARSTYVHLNRIRNRLEWAVIGVITISGLVACDTSAPGVPIPQFDHAGLSVVSLAGAPVPLPDVIESPSGITWTNDGLLVLDVVGAPWFHLLSDDGSKVKAQFGNRGEDSGDFAGVLGYGRVPGSADEIWVFDPHLRRVTVLGTESDALDSRVAIRGRLTVEHGGDGRPVSRLLWFEEKKLLGMSSDPSDRFRFFQDDGVAVASRSGPLVGDASIAEHHRVNASYSLITLCRLPTGDGFALAYGSLGRVEYYDLEGVRWRIAEFPLDFRLPFEPVSQDSGIAFVHQRTYYVDCAVAGDHLFVLFSGRHTSAFPSEGQAAAEFVHILDSDGKLVQILRLDVPAVNFAVDDEARKLYALPMGDPSVRVYALPMLEGK
jgi:hypothetical protein